ncbi:capsid protein [Crucivirus-482]|nr:capsid protein [Crucivirus-482]
MGRFKRKRGAGKYGTLRQQLFANDIQNNNIGPTMYGRTWNNMVGDNYMDATDQQRAYRRAFRYRGQGDYKSFLGWGARGIGAMAGGAAGFMSGGFGGAARGATSGWGQGANFSRMAGWGDYGPVSANQLINGGDGSQQQISVNQDDLSGDIYITNTEYVTNLDADVGSSGQSPFAFTKYALNPGLQKTFPFLSHIARNYVLYDFQGLIFQYKPISGEGSAASNNAIGKVIMATQYDPDAPDFISGVQMENYGYSNSTKPSVGCVHGIETAPGKSHMDLLYVRFAAGNKDLSFTDLGTLYVATEGVPGTSGDKVQIGELWVTYKIRLSRASIDNHLLGKSISNSHVTWTGATNDIYDAKGFDYEEHNDLDIEMKDVSATKVALYFPADVDYADYRLIVKAVYGAADTGSLIFAATGNLYVTFWNDRITSAPDPALVFKKAPETAVSSTDHMVTVNCTVDAPGSNRGVVIIEQSATADTGAYELTVTKINSVKKFIYATE